MCPADRRGAPWTADEVTELVNRIRAGTGRADIARALGRSEGALFAAAHRLIAPDRRPAARSESWKLLCRDLASMDPGADPDWWARSTGPRLHTPRTLPALKPASPDTTVLTSSRAGGAPATWMREPGDMGAVMTELGLLVAEAVGELVDDRLRSVMLRRLGLIDGPKTLQSIGEEWGISRERVRQLEDKALARIQSRARRSGSFAESLSAVISKLADSDGALAPRLVDAAEALFRCHPVWLVKAVYRMAGHSPERAERLGTLARQYLVDRRNQLRTEARAQAQQATIDRFVDKWVCDAAWPATTSTSGKAPAPICRRRMPITDDGVGFSGSFYSEKLGGTVYFESQLEEIVFTVAERSVRVHGYQEQPCEISYTTDGRRRTYFPDLLVTLTDGRILLIEIKPLWQMAVTENRIKSAAGRHFAAERGWGWLTVADRGLTYRDLLLREIDHCARHTLTQALATGPISWKTMQQLRFLTPITALDVAAYAVQENIALSLAPYRLGP